MDVINKDLLEQLKEFQEEGVVVEVFDFEDYMDKFCHLFRNLLASLKGEVDYRFLLFN